MILTTPAHCGRRLPTLLVLSTGAALLALLGSSPTLARTTSTPGPSLTTTVTGSATDPDDTAGRLDISRVTDRVTQIDRRHSVVTFRVRTLAAFDSQRLSPRHRNFVLELNRDSQRGSERNVRISSRDGRLVAEVISNATREVIATVGVTRPTGHTVRISGAKRIIGARSYFWTSNYHARRSPQCGQGDGYPISCQDSAPQRGWFTLDSIAWPDNA